MPHIFTHKVTPESQQRESDVADRQLARKQKENQIELERVAGLKAQGLNADGSPVRPDFENLIDPETGLLESRFQLGGFDDVSTDDRGLNKFRDEALREGPSAFAKLQREQLGVDQAQRLDDAAAQSAQGRAQALSQLASTGGVSGAARERLARSSGRDLLRSRQDVGRQGQVSGLNIAAQDEQRRVQQLGQLPGLELQRAGLDERNRAFSADVQSRNIQSSLAEKNLQRTQDLEAWRERMRSFSTGKQADAQAKAGGGGKK